ncbi:helix-turn-helix domain-containing protein [Streptomyces sp. NPDC088785]|uniref:helix-turn-helix domain-containing protein n=1 Tax=Streptomyces sp. NPDC088785 TaxID=3365897 RepID=UPI0037FADA5E
MDLLYDNRVLPAGEQAAWWSDTTVGTSLPTHVRPERSASFPVRVTTLALGEALVNTVSRPPETAARTAALIRRCDPETYQLELITTGRKFLAQAHRACELGPGQLVLYSSSHPLESRSVPARPTDARAASVIAHVPRRLLPVPSRHAAALLATPLQSAHGPGLLLAQMLRGLTEGGDGRTSALDRARLGSVLIDLVGAVLAHRLELDTLDADAQERMLSLRVHSYIRRNLSHPELSPSAIAAAHQISVRSLQRLLRAEGTTATELVRRQRLGQAAQALADPRQATVPVHAVGARWGFPRAADFSRAFRSVYGVPPGEFRLRARAGGHSQVPVAER